MLRLRALALVAPLLLVAGKAPASIWPTAARRVERELAAEDPDVRRRAAEAIVDLPRGAARRLLDLALSDPSPDVRLAAAEVATRVPTPELGARLSSWLSDSDSRIRIAAAEALAAHPDRAALAALGRASSDVDAGVRTAVARALGAAGSPEAVLPLLGRLDDAVPDVRREVILALGRLRDRRSVIPLLAKVEDPAAVVRRAAALALGALGDARAVGALVLALRDQDETVRMAAIEAVGRLGDPSVVASLVAVLSDATTAVRAEAVKALGRLGTPEATTAVVSELGRRDADIEPLLAAIRLGGKRALGPLRVCVDAQRGLRSVNGCVLALGELGDENNVERVRRALERGDASPRAAIRALGTLGRPEALPTVLERLSDPDGAVRREALLALANLLDPARADGRAVDPLVRALNARGRSSEERLAVLSLLGRSGARRAAVVLADVAAHSTSADVVAAALEGLGTIGPAGYDRVLLEGLDHEDGAVRTAAALALRRAGSARVVGPLLDRFEGAGGQDRGALGIALAGVAVHGGGLPVVGRLLDALAVSRGAERDGLIEALGEVGAPALAALGTLSRSRDPADRAKVAEALAGLDGATPLLAKLGADRDPGTRAAAVWGLGSSARASEASWLARTLADENVMVAANAAAALGRVAARTKANVSAALCRALVDERAAVRANALAGLVLASADCTDAAVTELLLRDRSESVRAAAARLLLTRGGPEARDALSRCADEDQSARVAAVCNDAVRSATSRREPALVFVVPVGELDPAPGAPFALGFADGTERLGLADRRGAVFERSAPFGSLSLELFPSGGD